MTTSKLLLKHVGKRTGNLVDKESNFRQLLKVQEELLIRQEILVNRQEILVGKQETGQRSITETIDFLNSTPGIRSMSVKDYGRLMGTLADSYAEEFLSGNTELTFADSKDMDGGRDGNESGYDRITTNGLRLQIKFRQVSGKDLYSHQTYLETTRRRSKKNQGFAGNTGHVAYKADEFDAVFFILAPKDSEKRDRKYWNYSCVFVEDILNPENKQFVNTAVSSKALRAGNKWKERLHARNQ